jgi:hypothetical protein
MRLLMKPAGPGPVAKFRCCCWLISSETALPLSKAAVLRCANPSPDDDAPPPPTFFCGTVAEEDHITEES